MFQWADRFRTFKNSYEDLARDSYYLLTERLRDEGERKETMFSVQANTHGLLKFLEILSRQNYVEVVLSC